MSGLAPAERAGQIKIVLSEVARHVESPDAARDNRLSGALGGAALLHAYLHLAFPEDGWKGAVEADLDRILDAAHAARSLDLYSGIAGHGWLLQHLARALGDSLDLSSLDDVLMAKLDGPWTGHFELITGLAGIGIYAVDRPEDETCRRMVGRVIEHLEATAQQRGTGVAWYTPRALVAPLQRSAYPDGNFNLGVAHGQLGVIAFLARAWQADLSRGIVESLVDRSVGWVLAKFVRSGPRWVLPAVHGSEPGVTRLAWCYNELGAAVVLLQAGYALGRTDWIDRANEILGTLIAVAPGESGIRDASLCHGTAGAAQLFSICHRMTGREEYLEEADRWIDRTLALRRPGEGPGGFVYQTFVDGRWVPRPDAGFLEGASGVSLALLARISPVPPGWIHVLGLW